MNYVGNPVNKTLLLLFFVVLAVSVQAQVYVPKTTPYNEDVGSIKNDSAAVDSSQGQTTGNNLDTQVDYDLTDLYNLDLTEAERAQAKAIIEVFTEQISADSTDISAYVNRGSYWATLGLHVQAIKDYNSALEIDPNQPIIYYNRALSKARFFFTYDACLDLKKAYELGLMQAGTLMDQKCGRHKAKLDAADTVTTGTNTSGG